jgi:hypothetical protein
MSVDRDRTRETRTCGQDARATFFTIPYGKSYALSVNNRVMF